MASLTTSLLSFLLPAAKSPPPSSSSSRVSVRCSNEEASASASATAVMFPSLANSNTLYAKSAYNVQVVVDDNEPEERLMNRFRREVMRSGVIQECKRRRYHENKQDEKKRRVRDAAKRNRRRRPPPKFAEQNTSVGGAPASKREDDEDNWDLPQGKIPY